MIDLLVSIFSASHLSPFSRLCLIDEKMSGKRIEFVLNFVLRGETLSLLGTDGAYFDSSFSLKRLFGCVPKVDWYPWGEEAFAEARKREVPIFLSSKFKFSSTVQVDMLCAPLVICHLNNGLTFGSF